MFARHPTLTASTVETVSNVPAFRGGVWIKPSGADVYVRTDGTDPTVGGNDAGFVPNGGGQFIPIGSDADGVVDVKLISAGTPTVHVEVY